MKTQKNYSFAFRVEEDIHQKLVELARKWAVPMTQIYRWALLEYLDEHGDDDQTSRHRMPPHVPYSARNAQ